MNGGRISMTTTEDKGKELWWLKEFCQKNYYTTYKQWLTWYNDGDELATQCIYDEEGELYIDQNYFEEWLKDYVELSGYSREVAEEYVNRTYGLDSSKWLAQQEITGEVVDVWKNKKA